jgi:hypothetical protein
MPRRPTQPPVECRPWAYRYLRPRSRPRHGFGPTRRTHPPSWSSTCRPTASTTPSAKGTPPPLLVASPIYCPIHENTPGPSALDMSAMNEGRLRFMSTGDPAQTAAGRLTLTVIRDSLTRIVRQRAATDPNLHYLDGLDLYSKTDHAQRPLPDELHPDPATHQHIGERFAHVAFDDSGPFTMEHG